MWPNIITTPPKARRISLVTKGESVLPQPVKRLSLLEKEGYKVVDTLGEGSFAKVKLAESEKHGCLVAMKIINKVDADEEYVKRFLPREVLVMKRLQHPHIIQLLEAFETETKAYMIMEYAPHGDLLERIEKRGVMDEDTAKLIFYQLATAMAYCKNEDVSHRDIKCENLLLDAEDHLKVTDFGFATHTTGGILLKTNCGSFDYAAPEVLCNATYNGHQADVWSMGVTLYVMLNKSIPFTLQNRLDIDFSDKVKFSVKVSKDCKNLVRRMLTPEPIKRITIREILESAWLKKVPKKNPDLKAFSTSQIQLITEVKPRTISKRVPGQPLIKCASTYSPEEVERERRDSTLVTDVIKVAQEEYQRQERLRKMKDAEQNPITELIHYKYAKNVKYQVNEEKELQDLKQSRAAYAAQLAAQESKDQRKKEADKNKLKSWKDKYGWVLAPPKFVDSPEAAAGLMYCK